MNKSHSQKWILIQIAGIGLILMSLALIYLLQTSKRLANYKTVLHTYEQVIEAPEQLQIQQAKLAYLDSLTLRDKSPGFANGNHLEFVQYLEALCRENEVRIVNLPIENEQDQGAYRLLEEQFSLEGSLHNMILIINQLEQKDKVGWIGHLSLKRKQMRMQQQKKWLLIADVKLSRITPSIQS